MPNLTPEEIAAMDAGYWAMFNKIILPTGPFSFSDHEYQIEPMSSIVKRMCCQKATQGGWTEIEVLKVNHGLIHKRFPQGVLYMFPTTDNVREFSKSRFNTLIAANPHSIGKFIKPGGKGTDSVSMKKIHDSILYLRGARLSQSVDAIGSEKGSVQLASIPVDKIIFDELDLMDDSVIEKAQGRMKHSKIQEESYLSNPILPDSGINAVFQTSDQRHLFRRCKCGEWTCAEISFPECVKIRKDGTGYIGCNKCGKEIGFKDSEWVPSERSNSDYMHGYQWSQLSSVFSDPAEILDKFNNPPRGNLADVYRLRLGLPYVAAEDRLAISSVYRCCGTDIMPTSHVGPCAMGVDVGKIKHVIIGLRIGVNEYEILKVAQLSSWNDIHDLAYKFNVKSSVVDIRPYEDAAREFQKTEPYKTYLCEYNESTTTPIDFNEKTGIVRVNRTEIFDTSYRMIANKTIVFPRKSDQFNTFAKQFCGCAKVLETNTRTGTSVYRYRKLGTAGDHGRNALNYFLLACKHCRVISRRREKKIQKFAINNHVSAIGV